MLSEGISDTSPFAQELHALARAEAASPLPAEPILFYGSSSIRLWGNLRADFADLPVVNHGFGGSTLNDCLAALGSLVYPVKPKAIVLYAGDNDLDQGASPEHVTWLLGQLISRVQERLGAVPLLCLSVKPSPVRMWNIGAIRRANHLMAELIAGSAHVHYVDVFSPMLDPWGSPRHAMFTEDGLHMNRGGYNLWAAMVWERLAHLHLID